jgi:hypothetical protein
MTNLGSLARLAIRVQLGGEAPGLVAFPKVHALCDAPPACAAEISLSFRVYLRTSTSDIRRSESVGVPRRTVRGWISICWRRHRTCPGRESIPFSSTPQPRTCNCVVQASSLLSSRFCLSIVTLLGSLEDEVVQSCRRFGLSKPKASNQFAYPHRQYTC